MVDNTTNGLFIRLETPAGSTLRPDDRGRTF
jgi:hypothetical protein